MTDPSSTKEMLSLLSNMQWLVGKQTLTPDELDMVRRALFTTSPETIKPILSDLQSLQSLRERIRLQQDEFELLKQRILFPIREAGDLSLPLPGVPASSAGRSTTHLSSARAGWRYLALPFGEALEGHAAPTVAEALQAALESYAADGWECVGVLPALPGRQPEPLLLLKRPA